MRRTRIAAVATAGALAAAGTGVAVATSDSDDAKQREQAVLEDAAGRLDVEADELREALSDAQAAQLDAEVKAGNITQEQADAIKQMRDRSGLVLGGPGPGVRIEHGLGFKGGFAGGPGEIMSAAAKALGITEAKLFEQLRDGKTLEEIAKANGKDVADVKAAIRAAVKTGLDDAVDAGELTQEQADAMLDDLTEHLDDGRLGGPLPRLGLRMEHDFGFKGGFAGGPGEIMSATAKALGITEAKLFEQLRDGKTLEEIAKANGKDVADVKAAIRAAVKTGLDDAVKAGKLTQEQADDMLERLTAVLDEGRLGGPLPGLDPRPPGVPGFGRDEVPAPPPISGGWD